jgi:hypothetical protein
VSLKFDPVRVGQLELGWWRAHNEKNKPEMVKLLTQQNMELYGLSKEEAMLALKALGEGIGYHDSREWDKAVEAVARYYEVIKKKTGLLFDSHQVAKLEVGWWQLHDKLEHNPDKSELAKALTLLYATIFGLPIERLEKAGKIRAEATWEHDLAEDPTTPENLVESHWVKTGELHVEFYKELQKAIITP